MNILVCIKQVPDTTEIKIDPLTNTLLREGVPSIVNTFDGYALEMAALIKDNNENVKITVISMGPEQAKDALRECMSVGADKAYLISDKEFAGSDTLATGYILSKAVKAMEAKEGTFDIIFCGKQAIDGDTAQVGPQLAECLNYPQITCIIEAEAKDGKVKVKRETENGTEIWESSFPVLLTASKPEFDPRFPTIRGKIAAKKAQIPVLSMADIQADKAKCGLKGSPTKVKKSFVPKLKNDCIIITGETAEISAKKMVLLLNESGLV